MVAGIRAGLLASAALACSQDDGCRAGTYVLAEVFPIEGSCDETTMSELLEDAMSSGILAFSVEFCGERGHCGASYRRINTGGFEITWTLTEEGVDGLLDISALGCGERFEVTYEYRRPCPATPPDDDFPFPDAAVSEDAPIGGPDALVSLCDGSVCMDLDAR